MCKSENRTTEICSNQGPSVLRSNFPESDYLEQVVEGSRQCKRRSSKNIEQQYDPWMPLCRQYQQSRLMTPGLVFHFKRQAYKYKALFDADMRPFRSGKNNKKLENFFSFLPERSWLVSNVSSIEDFLQINYWSYLNEKPMSIEPKFHPNF